MNLVLWQAISLRFESARSATQIVSSRSNAPIRSAPGWRRRRSPDFPNPKRPSFLAGPNPRVMEGLESIVLRPPVETAQ